MFHKDTIRLIRKTSKRFISLTMIVFIGVAFMMGLISTPDIMRGSVDKYNDNSSLHDIQIYSAYGFCAEDIREIRKIENVDNVFASKFKDIAAYVDDSEEVVVRVEEINRPVNKVELIEGRLPQKEDECVILASLNGGGNKYIGKKLSFYIDKDGQELSDYLKNDTYTIVGTVSCPVYLSKTLGSSTLDNKDLSLVCYVKNSQLVADYYSTVYLTIDGSKELISYSDEYKNFIDANIGDIETLAYYQQDYYRNKLLDEYQQELDEKRNEFEEKKAEGQLELDKAKQQLDDANVQIIHSQTEIATLNEVIKTLQNEAYTYQRLLDERKEELGYTDEDIENAKASFIASVKNFDEFVAEHDSLKEAFRKIGSPQEVAFWQRLIDSSKEVIKETRSKIYGLENTISSAKAQYNEGVLEYTKGLNEFNEEIEKAQIELKKAQQDLDDLPNASWTILDREKDYSSYMYKGSCNQMAAICSALPVLFYLVGALVCLTTMTRLVDEQRSQIGIFSALGFSKGQILSKYIVYALLASVSGGLVGAFVGYKLFPTVIYNAWRLMYVLPPMENLFSIRYLFLCILAFSALMCFVTYKVIENNLKEVPASLMRPKAPKVSKETFIEKMPFIWKRLSFSSKVTARNLIRYKSRFFMTVIGVAGCTGLLIIGFGIKDSISDIIKVQYENMFKYNYEMYFEKDENMDENIRILLEDETNEAVVPFMSYSSKVFFDNDSETINAQVFDSANVDEVLSLRLTDRKTPLYLDNRGIIISEKFAKNNDIHKGDMIILESKNGIKAEAKVSEICELYFQHYCFISDAYYEKIFGEAIHNTNVAVISSDPSSLEKDSARLSNFLSMRDFSKMVAQFENMLDALNLIIYVIILTAGSLAFVVLINLTQVNISERIREIATLKVLGFNRKEIYTYIFKEIMILSFIGALIGLPLGTVEHHFIMNVINMDMVMFGMNISLTSYLISFVITTLFTFIVLLFSRKSLRKVEMVESLKSVE